MPVFSPDFITAVRNVPAVRGFLLSPPFAYPTAAYQWTQEAGTGINGHYHKGKGEVHGSAFPKPQDTYITGTAGRTGRDFTVVAGSWKDDYVNPRTHKYELLKSASTGTFDIHSTSTTTNIENAEIVLRRGMGPESVTLTSTNYFCYLYFAYGSQTDYRFGWQYGKPAHLDYTEDGWTSFKTVGVCRDIGNTDAFLAGHNDELNLHLLPDFDDQTFSLIISNRDYLYHVAKGIGGLLALPNPGNLRLVGENGWVSLGYYPYRYKDAILDKSPVPIPPQVTPENARVVVNGRGITDSAQTTNIGIGVTQGLGGGLAVGFTATATKPDAGDGLGATTPPKLVDATIIFPAVWADDIGGIVNPNTEIEIAAGMSMQLLEVLDDASRTRYSSCLVPINNWRSQYSGTFAHAATSILATNGVDPYYKAFEGIAGIGDRGWEFVRNDPMRLLYMPCSDYSIGMQVPLGFEICLDGWCIFSAVRFLAEIGNVHPRFMQSIPLYIPPGATAQAPYGPAGPDCPFFILAKGTGLNAKYKFLPDWTPWAILQLLVQDAGETDPISGANIPYYMGFTEDGQFHFEPYSPFFYNPVIAFSDTVFEAPGLAGYGLIEEFHLFNSVAQMRTSIDFQGIDAWSNELLYYHITMPDPVLRAVGFRFPWLERNARYASYDYITSIANSAAVQASLPTQVVYMKTVYHPYLHPGMTCLVSESATLGGTALFYITEMRSQIGIRDLRGRSGAQDCYSYITARRVENF